MAYKYLVPTDEIESAISLLNAALAMDKVYDCRIDYGNIQQAKLSNVRLAIIQLNHAEKALSTPPEKIQL